MLLKCDCVNSSADAKYGKGIRRHTALVPIQERPGAKAVHVARAYQEFACVECSYVRTLARGKQTGAK